MIPKPVKLYFKSCGQGEPIIILHGLLGSSSNWSTTSELLGRQLQVFTVDLRNHGNSPHATDFSFCSMAEDLKYFMECQYLSQAILMGHSLGGRIAMEFADRYPEMVSKLIVVDVAPKAYAPTTHNAMIDAMIALNLNMYDSTKEVAAALAEVVPSLQVRNFLVKNIFCSPNGNLFWKVNLKAIRDNIDSLSCSTSFNSNYMKPVLFIRGELSDYVLEEDKHIVMNIYPQAQIVTVAGAGHWVHVDAKNKLLAAVNKFAA